MIGLLIVTHGNLCKELLLAAEHVVGPQAHLRALSIEADDDMEERREDIKKAVQELDQGKGVIILTDMLGGTPSNLALPLLEEGRVEVLAGVNLPMLIKLAEMRRTSGLDEVVRGGCEAGRKYITIASEVMSSLKG